MEVLPSNNLKIGSICQGCEYQVGNPGTSSSRLKLRCMTEENGFKQGENRLVSGGQVLRQTIPALLHTIYTNHATVTAQG